MGDRMTAPFVLSLIGGILMLLVALGMIVLGAIVGSLINAGVWESIYATANIPSGVSEAVSSIVMTIFFATEAAALVLGAIVIIGAVKMRNPEKAKGWGIAVLVLSVISILVGGGGFIIGSILGIIGGALGISRAGKKA